MNNFYRKIIYVFFLCLGVFNFPFGIEKVFALECSPTHYNCVVGYPTSMHQSGTGGEGWGYSAWYWRCTEQPGGVGAAIDCVEQRKACVHDVCGAWSACSNGNKSRVCNASDTDCNGQFSITETQPCPACGSASGSSFVSVPTTNLCSVGSASTLSGSGSGKDGSLDLSPSSATTYNLNTTANWPGSPTTAPGVNFSVTENRAITTNQIVIDSSTAAGLAIGDEILIINLQGTSSNYSNVGQYETVTIKSITTNSPTGKSTLTLNSFLINGYDGTTQKIMVQRIPNWTDVTIGANATLTADAWNGVKGGVVVFRSNGTINKAGIIDMKGKGFRGATVNGFSACGYPWPTVAGDRGESYAGINSLAATGRCASVLGNHVALSAIGGGGGGGAASTSTGRGGGGGGGAGYSAAGTAGGQTSYAEAGGPAGGSYGSTNLSTIYLGSGGGESGTPVNYANNPGGNGGGLIIIYGNNIQNTGAVNASGNDGSNGFSSAADDCQGGGGGGSGGSVLITGNVLSLGSSIITSVGGSGGVGGTNKWGGTCGAGGAGSTGRVAINYYGTISGTTSPASTNTQKTSSLGAAGPWEWYCVDGNNYSAKCSATQITPTCGSANNSYSSSAPTANLCVTGANAVTKDWANYDFSARKAITIANNSGTVLTNYQTAIAVAYETAMQADFDDIRFYDASKNELNYWLETKTNSTLAKFWVKVPSIPVAGTTIYMYYGNSSVGTLSNGNNVFVFFDDFNDLSKWNTTPIPYNSGTGSISVSGGEATIASTNTTGVSFSSLSAVPNRDIKIRLNMTYQYASSTYSQSRVQLINNSAADPGTSDGLFFYVDGLMLGANGAQTAFASTFNSSTGVTYEFSSAASAKLTVNDVVKATLSNTVPSHADKYIRLWSYYNSSYKLNWILISEYAATEPAVTVGSAEALTPPAFPTSSPWSWQCYAGGPVSEVCTAAANIPGCGSANGTTVASAPTSDLCNLASSAVKPDWGDYASSKRRSITITNSNGSALTNYQVAVNIPYYTGMQTDFDDLRFTAADKTTPLSYWLESKTDSSTAKVWVKVPSIPVTGTTIYVYYGNASATSLSNGNNTFAFYDNFDGTSLGSGWTSTGLASASVTGGYVDTEANASTWQTGSGLNYNGLNLTGNFEVMGNFSWYGRSADLAEIYMSLNNNAVYVGMNDAWSDNNGEYKAFCGGTAWESGLGTAAASGTASVKISRVGNTIKTYQDGTERCSGTYSSPITNILFSNDRYQTYAGKTARVYSVIVRSLASSEPVPTVSSTEETYNAVFATAGPWQWKCANSSGTVNTDTCTANQSGAITITNPKNPYQIDATNKTNNYWYCSGYFDSTNTYQVGRSGSLDFQFNYSDSTAGSTLRNYRFAFSPASDPAGTDAIRVPVDNSTDLSLEWTNISSPYIAIGGTVNANNAVTVNKTSSQSLGQIAYGNSYNWWVKLKNSGGTNSSWIPGGTFSTLMKKAPIIKFLPSNYIIYNRKVRFCSTADITNPSDPCYSTCWKGTGTPANSDLEGSNWKCSICYDSSNVAVPCSSSNSNTFTWTLPSSGVTFGTGSTAATANPELLFTSSQPLKLKINDSVTGVTCGYQRTETSDTSSIGAKAKWVEK